MGIHLRSEIIDGNNGLLFHICGIALSITAKEYFYGFYSAIIIKAKILRIADNLVVHRDHMDDRKRFIPVSHYFNKLKTTDMFGLGPAFSFEFIRFYMIIGSRAGKSEVISKLISYLFPILIFKMVSMKKFDMLHMSIYKRLSRFFVPV